MYHMTGPPYIANHYAGCQPLYNQHANSKESSNGKPVICIFVTHLLPPHSVEVPHQWPPHVHQRLEHARDDGVEACGAQHDQPANMVRPAFTHPAKTAAAAAAAARTTLVA
jgi:hypothetical protein